MAPWVLHVAGQAARQQQAALAVAILLLTLPDMEQLAAHMLPA